MKRREFITAAGSASVLFQATSANAQKPNMEDMHPAKYKALEASTLQCIAAGEDCMRHSLSMIAMNDTSMAGVANSVTQLLAVCRALLTLAALNSPFTVEMAKTTADVCGAAEKECRKYYDKYPECKACADACKACAADCLKVK
jgi:Cys-rich four helix bundle protein (predicted Tat secretion target)